MKLSRLIIAISVCFFITGFSYGQAIESIKGTKGTSVKHARVGFNDMVEYEKLHPPKPRVKTKKPPKVFPLEIINEDYIKYQHKDIHSTQEYKSSKAVTEDSPLPDLNFQGLDDNFDGIPPDVNAAAGLEHIMITLNTQVRIQDKEGNTISTVGIGSFWSSVTGGSGAFDPRIAFDPYNERWIVVAISGSSPSSSRLLVGMSETSDPEGTWNLYSINSDETNVDWMDYPMLGFNKNWVVITGNMFSANNFFQQSAIFAFDINDLLVGAVEASHTRFEYNVTSTIYPAMTYDTEVEEVYFVTELNTTASYGIIGTYMLEGEVGDEEFTFNGYTTTTTGWVHHAPGFAGNFAPQLGSSDEICSNDADIHSVVFRNNKMWAAHHIFVPKNNPTRSVIQWWELDTDGDVLQKGWIDESDYHFTMPSIAVNAVEEIFIGYSSFSDDQYASCSYSFRSPDDPEDEMQTRYQYKDGLAKYVKKYGGDRNRWGDYSSTVVDPADDLSFWTLQEYANLPSGSTDKWATWWAYLEREAKPEAQFSSNEILIPVGGSVDFFDESLHAPTSWLWTFEGGTPSTSTDQHPQNILFNTAGTFDVTLEATNDLGSTTITTEDYITTNTTVLPDIMFYSSDTIPCVGQEVEIYDYSMHNVNEWAWEVSPSTFSFENGTNANSKNPVITFQEAVSYSVSLTASNLNGDSDVTKTDYILSGGASTPFTETFEFVTLSASDWTIENPDDAITWKMKAVDGNTPGNMAPYVNLYKYTAQYEHDRLISPPLNFTSKISIILNFQHAYAQRISASADSLNVYISSDCGSTWTKVFGTKDDGSGSFATAPDQSNTNFIPVEEDDWCGSGFGSECYSIDITQWAANESGVQIMFESVSFAGNNLFIDNVQLDAVTIKDEINSETNFINVYPNPSNGHFTLIVDELDSDTEVNVLNMAGQVVYSTKFNSNISNQSRQLDLSKEPKGVYIIKLVNETLNQSEKVILK